MSPGTLDDGYLSWLYGQVADVRTRKSSKTYWDLFRQLYSTEFVWLIPNDDNRAADGKELRREWAAEVGINPDPEWLALECSFLEMLIGLSRRISFETDEEPEYWFWHLLDNLGLHGFNDRSHYSPEEVQTRINTVIMRTYDPDGCGGLFPMQRTREDQREVELWYQLSAYLLQN